MTTDKKNEVPPVDMQAIRGQLVTARSEINARIEGRAAQIDELRKLQAREKDELAGIERMLRGKVQRKRKTAALDSQKAQG